MKLLVISNMYPSDKDPAFGVFVRNFFEYVAQENGENNTDLVAVKGHAHSGFDKLRKYFVFYLKIIFCTLFKHYDLIYVHFITYPSVPLRIVNAIKPLPLAFNIHGSDWITHSGLASRLKKVAIPLLMESRLIVIPSTVFVEQIKKELPLIDESKLFVSHSGGIDLDIFRPLERINKTLTLGFVSRITELKGWRVFVEAIYQLKKEGYKVKGIMVGGGEQSDELHDLIINRGLAQDIQCLGAVAQKDLPSVYNQMTLFIFPTLYFESLGLVGLEAMACGVPVVGSNQGGLKEYIKNGENGFFFEVNDASDLSTQVKKYLQFSDSDREAMTENALKTAMAFKNSLVMEELMKEINRCG